MRTLLAYSLCFLTLAATAQDKRTLDSTDKVILTNIIRPAEQAAGGREPDWTALTEKIKDAYSPVQADRAVTKAQIYYYWNKDWPKFSKALVHFTDAYEDKEDGQLMNRNAKMILDHSADPADWKAAQAWIKHALDKEPTNATYQTTYDGLTAKWKSQP